MNGRIHAALATLLLVLASGTAMADVTLAPVIVKGTTIDGTNVACYGSDCAAFLFSIGGVEPGFRTQQAAMGEGGGGQLSVTKQQFCTTLASQRPPNCNAASPPSVPVYDPLWEPNGCGTGGLANFFAERMMGIAYSEHFSGNLNSPYKSANNGNISFQVSCNDHDRCWGSGFDRPNCDIDFKEGMFTACDVLTSPAEYGTCTGMASAYYSAVSSDGATEHYEEGLDALKCAVWAYDMKRNGCA